MPAKRKRQPTVVPPKGWRPVGRGPKYKRKRPKTDPEPKLSLPDQKVLARLVRRYNRGTIAIAAEVVVLPKAGRPRRGEEPKALAPLSLRDTKRLATLVHKNLRAFIVKAAQQINARGPGRPRREQTVYEQMHLADWIKDCAEEYRALGRRYPEHDATLELHEMENRRGAKVSDAWLKTMKNKRLLGEQGFRNLARQIQEQPDAAKALGLSLEDLTHWLKPRK
jgi:hypothetical protein